MRGGEFKRERDFGIRKNMTGKMGFCHDSRMQRTTHIMHNFKAHESLPVNTNHATGGADAVELVGEAVVVVVVVETVEIAPFFAAKTVCISARSCNANPSRCPSWCGAQFRMYRSKPPYLSIHRNAVVVTLIRNSLSSTSL